ncbi:hypothetical protein [Streptomyces hundungensis]|uniref:hypothetical protein n=1 Tax=Streptomyces hundungensis TaxID=1077946 RepID=UPI0031E8E204
MFFLAARGEDGLHELAYDVERDAFLLLTAAGGQQGAAAGRGLAADLGHQCGLAQSGRAGDGEQSAVGRASLPCPAAQVVQHAVEQDQFFVALKEHPVRHAAPALRLRHSGPLLAVAPSLRPGHVP